MFNRRSEPRPPSPLPTTFYVASATFMTGRGRLTGCPEDFCCVHDVGEA